MGRVVLMLLLCVVLAGCGDDGAPATTTAARGADAVVAQDRVAPRQLDLTVRSRALGRSARVRLLTPDGWRPGTGRRWPVLYLLHGCCDTYDSWTRSTDVEQLTQLRDVLVVMPEGGDVGFYSNWLDGPAWQDFHLRELPRILERGFGAGTRRAIAGLSMGGLGAIDYAARHPKLFRAAASFSGVLHPLEEPRVWLGLLEAYEPNPRRLWGDPRADRRVWAAHDPTELAGRLRGTRLFVASGDGRPPGGGRPDGTEVIVGRETRAFAARLRALGIPFEADLYRGGRHDWPFWERDLKRALPVLLGSAR